MARGFALFLVPLMVAMGGCSQTPSLSLGAITVTDAQGAIQPAVTTIEHGTNLYLEVTVNHDVEGLGADWTVTCSSSAPEGSLPVGAIDTSCGTFAPNHTISGPVPSYPASGILTLYTAPVKVPKAGTVTIVVHATAVPSVTANLTLNVD